MKEKILITYHSGAGSTKMTSEILAEKLKDIFEVTIQHVDFNYDYQELNKYDLLLFGFPTYHCEPSTSIMDFIIKMEKLESKIKTFFFTSYGLYTGNCSRIFYQKIKEKNLLILDFIEFRSPASDGVLMFPSKLKFLFNFENNYIKNLEEFSSTIKNYKTLKEKEKPAYKWYVPINEIAKVYAQIEYDRMKDNMHIIEDMCTNCDLCVKLCERDCWSSNSYIPSLNTENCEFCMECIHKCPKKAIIFSDRMISKPRLDKRFFKSKKKKLLNKTAPNN